MGVRVAAAGTPSVVLADGGPLEIGVVPDGTTLIREGNSIIGRTTYGIQVAAGVMSTEAVLLGSTHRQTWVEIAGSRTGPHTLLPPVTYYEISALVFRRAAATAAGRICVRMMREINAGVVFNIRSWRLAPEPISDGLILEVQGIPATSWGEGEGLELRTTLRQPIAAALPVADTWLECAYDGPETAAVVVGEVRITRFWLVGGG